MADDGSIKIEMGVPLPDRLRGGGPGQETLAIRALARAPIGASVFIPGKTAKTIGPYIGAAGFGFGWAAARTVDGGCRVWKFAEPKQSPKGAAQ